MLYERFYTMQQVKYTFRANFENWAMVNNLARVVGLLSIGLRMCLNAIIV